MRFVNVRSGKVGCRNGSVWKCMVSAQFCLVKVMVKLSAVMSSYYIRTLVRV